MKGRIADVPLAETLRDLFFDRADGILTVTGPSGKTEIFLDQGCVFYARSDSPEQKLERILVRWGLVSEQAIAAFVAGAGRDVRGALVREGIFPTPQAFDEFMAQILRERVMDCFTLDDGDFEFDVKDVRAMRQLAFPSTMPNVILEGVRRMNHAERSLAALIADDAPLMLNEAPAVPLQSLQMGPTEGFVLSLVTGRTSLSEIASVSPLGRDGTLRLLYGLLVLDVLRHPSFTGVRFNVAHLAQRTEIVRRKEVDERERISAEYARVRSQDLFQILPGAAGLSIDQLRVAVKQYQEQWAPGRFSVPVARAMRDELLLVAGRASELLLAAMEASRRASSGDLEAAMAAREHGEDSLRLKRMEFTKSDAQEKREADVTVATQWYRKALDAVKAKDFHDAVQFAREAIRRDERPEYQALLAEALTMNPHWSKKAEEAWVRAIQLDAYEANYPLQLGRLYARAGLKQRAREQYEKALTVQPDFEDAKLALKELR